MKKILMLAFLTGCTGEVQSLPCVQWDSAAPGQACDATTEAILDSYRRDYLVWKPVDDRGWTVSVVKPGSLGGSTNPNLKGWIVVGVTLFDDKVVQLDALYLQSYVHELEHVRLGADSALHCHWISDGFVGFELSDIGWDDTIYVETTCPKDY